MTNKQKGDKLIEIVRQFPSISIDEAYKIADFENSKRREKMTKNEWKTIKHFNPNEKWGDPEKMEYRLVWMLDRIREKIGKPIIIHCGYATDGHAENSYHYKGQAVDFHVEGLQAYHSFNDGQYLTNEWATFNMSNLIGCLGGLGIYPHWNNPGFHLDLGPSRQWWQDEEGEINNV